MPLDQGMIAKEGREAPLEAALKRAHRVVEQLEEQATVLEARLGRLMAESPVHIVGSLRANAAAHPPEPARAQMTHELSALAERVEVITARLRQIATQLDC